MREAARLIAEDERLTPVLVPLGDGLLAAARDWPRPRSASLAPRTIVCTATRR